MNFDKKSRKHSERFSLILDELDYMTHPTENSIEYSDHSFEKLENQISDPSLYAAFINLTKREREVLNLSIVRNMKDRVIANQLGVSQQSISKTKKGALKKFREAISRREGESDG
ncbi:sigma factor-like helix-turn-helix DNA-binding protein [Paenibacillus kribbensis]|uniref:sigma factor-like helix-turn-helix DNA-binding protein n=1 Tax=Paenibacillus kribbensis TaxID=172713 RepID=UPI001FC95A1E|nr:sigma factor-like helix-turn-helix DNA-binding protein [Paenibacillus kribbensis]